MALEDFFASFGPMIQSQLSAMKGSAPQPPQQAPQPQQPPQGGDMGFLGKLLQPLLGALGSNPQPQNNSAQVIREIVNAMNGDPLGSVARSNSRPSGFTPTADWEAWGPGARKPAPKSDARRGLEVAAGNPAENISGQAMPTGASRMPDGSISGPYGTGSVAPPQVAPVVAGAPVAQPISRGPTQGPPRSLFDAFNTTQNAAASRPPLDPAGGEFWGDPNPGVGHTADVARAAGATWDGSVWSTPPAAPQFRGGASPEVAQLPPPNAGFMPPGAQPISGMSWLDQVAQTAGAGWDGQGWSAPGAQPGAPAAGTAGVMPNSAQPIPGMPWTDQVAQSAGATWDGQGWSIPGPGQAQPQQQPQNPLMDFFRSISANPSARRVQ